MVYILGQVFGAFPPLWGNPQSVCELARVAGKCWLPEGAGAGLQRSCAGWQAQRPGTRDVLVQTEHEFIVQLLNSYGLLIFLWLICLEICLSQAAGKSCTVFVLGIQKGVRLALKFPSCLTIKWGYSQKTWYPHCSLLQSWKIISAATSIICSPDMLWAGKLVTEEGNSGWILKEQTNTTNSQ